MRLWDWLNTPLYEGSPYLGWAVPAVVAAIMLLFFFSLLLFRRYKSKNASATLPTTVASMRPLSNAATGEGISIANLQGLGMREQQQDAFGISPLGRLQEYGLLAVLCDGMGGMIAGSAIAKYTTAQALSCCMPVGQIDPLQQMRILKEIDAQIAGQYQAQGGCTLVLSYLLKNHLWFWCVGDSDLFLLREGELYALNARHEYRSELLKKTLRGELPLEVALGDPQGNALSQFMGNGHIQCDYTKRPFSLRPQDRLLLCSDGVSDALNLQSIAQCMELPPEACCEEIERRIQAARLKEQDNYTAIAIQFHS